MLGEVGIESRAAFHARRVMINYFVQGFETAVVHVRGGEGDIAQRRNGEFSVIERPARDFSKPKIRESFVETVIGEALALKQWSAMAVEAVGSELIQARVVFRREQFKASLFF